jgi:hypothetical protein
MESPRIYDWKYRLGVSIVSAAVAVVLSAFSVLALSLGKGPPGRGIEILTDILGIPNVAGWLFISVVFGTWRAFHQAAILLWIPLVSFVTDTLVIFLIWEFLHRKKSRNLDSDGVLHINR